MKFFYIKHHYLSVVRNSSFGGEVFAFIILFFILGSLSPVFYLELDHYSEVVNGFFGKEPGSHHLIIFIYIIGDLLLKQVLRRPAPKVKYYFLLGDCSGSISWQYLVTSLFGILPFILFVPFLAFTLKVYAWQEALVAVMVFSWWFINHCLGIWSQFGEKIVRPTVFLIAVVLLGSLHFFDGTLWSFQFPFWLGTVTILIGSVFGANQAVRKSLLEKLAALKTESRNQDLFKLINFNNPYFQLEWALLTRNKKTRSNLVLGIVAMLILPLYYDISDSLEIFLLFGFLLTGIFLLQHGVYSYGWEGSFFDFLLANSDIKTLLKNRWNFYAISCLVGGFFLTVIAVIYGIDLQYVFCILIFNVGVTIPLVLFRAAYHDLGIDLAESVHKDYRGMISGPIIFTSLLTIILPYFIYIGFGSIFNRSEPLILALFGIIGIVFRSPMIDLIGKRFSKRKYHLSQSFKA